MDVTNTQEKNLIPVSFMGEYCNREFKQGALKIGRDDPICVQLTYPLGAIALDHLKLLF